MKLRGLYAITPDLADSEELLRRAHAAMQGGVRILQYRSKTAPAGQRRAEAIELARLARKHAACLIVNDDLELALDAGADGVHLGREDGALAAARARLHGKLLGASCYDSIAAARAAVTAGADYVAFGSVFASPTKPAAVRAPLALFAAARSLGVPLVAIGGITLENAPQVLRAGADCVAVISDLFDAPDVAERARAYGRLLRHEITQ